MDNADDKAFVAVPGCDAMSLASEGGAVPPPILRRRLGFVPDLSRVLLGPGPAGGETGRSGGGTVGAMVEVELVVDVEGPVVTTELPKNGIVKPCGRLEEPLSNSPCFRFRPMPDELGP